VKFDRDEISGACPQPDATMVLMSDARRWLRLMGSEWLARGGCCSTINEHEERL
jgi:hypothetical protein